MRKTTENVKKPTDTKKQQIFLHFNIRYLHFLGLWPSGGKTSSWIVYHFRLGFTLINLCVILTLEVADCYFKFRDLYYITLLVSEVLINFQFILKIIYLVSKQKTIRSLIDILEKNLVLDEEVGTECYKQARTLILIFSFLASLCCLTWLILPFVDDEREADGLTRKLPFEAWTPFNLSNPYAYFSAYALHVSHAFIFISYAPAWDCFFVCIIIYICGQFKMLHKSLIKIGQIDCYRPNTSFIANEIETNITVKSHMLQNTQMPLYRERQDLLDVKRHNIGVSKEEAALRSYRKPWDEQEQNDTCTNEKLDEEMKALHNCIKIHQALLGLCQELEHIMSPIMLVQLVLSSGTLCLVLFQLFVVPIQNLRFVTVTGFLSAVLFELSLFSYFATKLKTISLETANAAYGCNWFDGSSQLKHELMFIIARTLNPVKLTCGKMYQLSLENLTEVLKTCFSICTMLRTLNES
ncbi:putative odorant receptor 85e isoform X2 [Periplaneta americana]|uniref:putative odorant receptor 85e isoform X2 n=1 Tax=Periplaneta americana TaxID=6978 RepID=UPI0037E84505